MSVITIRHDHYHYDGNKEILDEILKTVLNNQLKLKEMALTNQQLLDEINGLKTGLTDLSTQATKINGEVQKKLDALAAALENDANVSPEVETAFGELKTAFESHKTVVQGIDDLIPDTTA